MDDVAALGVVTLGNQNRKQVHKSAAESNALLESIAAQKYVNNVFVLLFWSVLFHI